LRPILKIALAIRPATDSAPRITVNSIGIEPDGLLAVVASAVARGTAATAVGGAAVEFAADEFVADEVATVEVAAVEVEGAAAPELTGAGAGLADGATLDGSGQRVATTDVGLSASPAAARRLLSLAMAAAGVAATGVDDVCCPVKTLVSCSTRICGIGNSARASATDRWVAAFGGETVFADGAESCGAVRACVSFSSRRYQQWRPVPRSMR
jgi:hypothetical protein